MGDVVITFEDVWYRYSKRGDWVLRGINLSIERGDFVLVIGCSGSGKTTLLRCLTGLIPHFYGGELRGKITVCGLDVSTSDIAEVTSKVAAVFQDPEAQILMLITEDELAYPLENLGLPPSVIVERVEWVAKLLGLEGIRYRRTFELSGGEKQRVVLATALVQLPEILVLDEPSTWLDPLTSKKLINEVVRIHHEHGITVVIAEHRLELVMPHSSKVIVLHNGKVLYFGDVGSALEGDYLLKANVGDPYIVRLWKYLGRIGKVPLNPDDFAKEVVKCILEKL
ncbi:MAG: ABC transporter ATP-binding protein [Thermoprotei archaeon]|nr:MAG: ABC transporter ATP-binding protein [Thermoprotei archaeon]